MVLDTAADLAEGQAVCVQPVVPADAEAERAARVRDLKRLFDEWTAEDAALTDAEADALGKALEGSGRARFRPADLT